MHVGGRAKRGLRPNTVVGMDLKLPSIFVRVELPPRRLLTPRSGMYVSSVPGPVTGAPTLTAAGVSPAREA